jgi:hypothetical protein
MNCPHCGGEIRLKSEPVDGQPGAYQISVNSKVDAIAAGREVARVLREYERSQGH